VYLLLLLILIYPNINGVFRLSIFNVTSTIISLECKKDEKERRERERERERESEVEDLCDVSSRNRTTIVGLRNKSWLIKSLAFLRRIG
jgi:hypothetical protein